MNIELIPVIEIECYDAKVELPNGPSWEYAKEWDDYRKQCLKNAGYMDEMKSYVEGSFFYKLSDVSDSNMVRIIKDQTEDYREESSEKDFITRLNGGYVLKIDGHDKLFPQCCSALSDISSWDGLFEGETTDFWIGHPFPTIIQKENTFVFDLEHPVVEEPFSPRPTDLILEVDKKKLKNAIDEAKKELDILSKRIVAINQKENLNIVGLDRILIYGEY